MLLLLPLIALLSSFSVFAEELILCRTGVKCKCTDPDALMVPADYYSDIKNAKIYLCKPIVAQMTKAYKLMLQRQGICEEDPESNSLFDQIVSSFPKGCGYDWKTASKEDFAPVLKQFLEDGKVLCQPSMCTSATFLAFVREIKRRHDLGLIADEQYDDWIELGGPAWGYINGQARPDLLFQELNIGEGKILRKDELPASGWPREGDFVQIWREDQSGHSVLFAGYLNDGAGVPTGICYWTSNEPTKGYAKRCESLKVVNRLLVGRFK